MKAQQNKFHFRLSSVGFYSTKFFKPARKFFQRCFVDIPSALSPEKYNPSGHLEPLWRGGWGWCGVAKQVFHFSWHQLLTTCNKIGKVSRKKPPEKSIFRFFFDREGTFQPESSEDMWPLQWRNFTLKLVNLDTYNLVPMESVSFSALLLILLRQSQLKRSNK